MLAPYINYPHYAETLSLHLSTMGLYNKLPEDIDDVDVIVVGGMLTFQ